MTLTLHEKLADGARPAGRRRHRARRGRRRRATLFARTILGWDRVRLLTERAAPPPPALEPTLLGMGRAPRRPRAGRLHRRRA